MYAQSKKFLILFMVSICYFNIALSVEHDAQGRTALMNYVIAQEDAIKKNRQEIERLWNVCYETVHVSRYQLEAPTVQEKLIQQLASPTSSPYTIRQIPTLSQTTKMSGLSQSLQTSNSSLGKSQKTLNPSAQTVRKKSCTDQDMQLYEQSQQDLTDLIMVTIEQIELMVQYENSLAKVDTFGKTVLNYCYTYRLYNKLRELGAPFQFDTWLYWNL